MDKNNQPNFHFIAIGGVGMSGLAKYLLEEGYSVSGSDINESKYFNQVKNLGARVFVGHDESNLPENSVIVASTAIKETNPELKKAKSLGLKVLHRSDLLKFIAENFQKSKGKFIGFSGTHGKTTTSGLSAYVMEKAGLAPSFVVGGIVLDIGTNAKAANGKYFSAELDESDGTILKYSPDVTVINNIEVDHVDFYKDGMESLLSTFTTFLENLKPESSVLINKDCAGNVELMRRNQDKKFITYGFSNADYTAENVEFSGDKTNFTLCKNGEILTQIKLSIHGKHNVCNALAVAAALCEAGIDIKEVSRFFEGFSGMGQRFQPVAEVNGIKIVDDYAHHPSEIKATLDCAKTCYQKNRVVAIFQPHRYTRLHGLYHEFLKAFKDADKVIVLDTYAASEAPIGGHTSEEFAKDLQKDFAPDCVVYIGGKIAEIASNVAKELKSGDVAITLGAGDVTKLGKAVAALLSEAVS